MERFFYTIGHSNRTAGQFIELLVASGIRALADVRAFPHSRALPQFNGEALSAELAVHDIAYRHFPALGGRRAKVREVDADANAYWENRSFHNYADYATTPAFREGLEELKAWQAPAPLALMCAEAVWWRCHRRIIADYLLADGCTVFHILGEGAVKLAQMTPGAVSTADGVLTYPPTSEEQA